MDNNDGGLSQYLLAGSGTGSNSQAKLDEYGGFAPGLSQKQDDDNMVVAQLLNEMNNIKEVRLSSHSIILINLILYIRPKCSTACPQSGISSSHGPKMSKRRLIQCITCSNSASRTLTTGMSLGKRSQEQSSRTGMPNCSSREPKPRMTRTRKRS